MQDQFSPTNIMCLILSINILPKIIQTHRLNRFRSIDKRNYNSKNDTDKLIITLMASAMEQFTCHSSKINEDRLSLIK